MSGAPGRGRGRALAHISKYVKTDTSYAEETSDQPVMSTSRGFARGRCSVRAGGSGDVGSREGQAETSQTKSLQTDVESMHICEEDEGEQVQSRGASGKRTIGRGGPRNWSGTTEIVKTKPEMCLTKKGVSGTRIQLQSNYFKLETLANWVIFQYRVDFNVEEEREGMKRKWLREHAEKLGRAFLFDGTSLFSSKRFTQDNKPLTLTSVRESDNFPVQIEIRLVQQLNYGNIVYLQVFGILLRRSLAHLKLQLVNRTYFDASAAVKLPSFNMEVWPGYITSIRQNETDILMCTELTHKIMRMDTALDLLSECTKKGQKYRLLFQQAVVGEVVLTDYNNKTYRVDDVDFSLNPESKFKLKSGEEISYIEYYENRYRIRIKDRRQPLLVSRSSARSIRGGMPTYCLLVPELCRMTGLTNKMLENFQLKKGLSEITRINPSERIRRVMKFKESLHSTPEIVQEFKEWDITIGKTLVEVPARELPPETIVGGKGVTYSAGHDADWTRELRTSPMLVKGKITEWAIICPQQLKRDLLPFLENLRRAASGMSMTFSNMKIFETATDKPAHLVEAVEEVMARSKPDLIMFVCPNNRADRYNAIKKKCGVDRGVASQVVLLRSLRSRGLSVATKIAVQLNCKVGGAPWSVEIPLKSVMVVGYDVCHDTRSKGKSYGAMVASLNNTLSSWFSAVSHHSSGEELSNTLSLDICKALRKYQELNGSLPGRIFVYRDGVGEGQISYVYEHEVTVLKERLTEIYGGPTWRMCYIIVTKRINTRLFKAGRNPSAGTVVDDVITLPERYDFYLISQNVNSGTVTPTNYNVISDNVGLEPDQIQRWTYKMTHLYYNWSGTVRVPAPCQYAHKLAFLVGQSLHIQPHPYLDTTLHFL